MPYADPTTGEFVAEFATVDAEANVTRRTEWFAREADARHFEKTGEIPKPLVGTSISGTVKHLVVKAEDGKRVAKCNPRSRLFDIDRGQANCPRCLGRAV